MSASSTPTFSPRSRKPSARLIAVVDLPTPPLPDATATIAPTPGGPCTARSPRGACEWPCPPPCGGAGGGGAARAAPAARSPVSATIADTTPGMARTAASAALRTGSHACTTAASTVIEKNTLPSLTTTSESLPVAVNDAPSGLFTCASLASTSSFDTINPFSGSLGQPNAASILHDQAVISSLNCFPVAARLQFEVSATPRVTHMADPLNVVIDLSHYNEVASFSDIRASGIVGVIHKATQGVVDRDPTYAWRRREALAAGLWWGAYHCGTNTDGAAQARFFLSVVNPGPQD